MEQALTILFAIPRLLLFSVVSSHSVRITGARDSGVTDINSFTFRRCLCRTLLRSLFAVRLPCLLRLWLRRPGVHRCRHYDRHDYNPFHVLRPLCGRIQVALAVVLDWGRKRVLDSAIRFVLLGNEVAVGVQDECGAVPWVSFLARVFGFHYHWYVLFS